MTMLNLTSNLIALGFQSLSDPIKLQVLELLREQELSDFDLCHTLDISQSSLYHHLQDLKDAQLVQAQQEGVWTYYSLNLDQFLALEQFLTELRRFSPMLSSFVNEG